MPQALKHPPLHLLMTTDTIGGVWTYSLDLAEALQAIGLRVTLAVIGPGPGTTQIDEATTVGIDLLQTGAALDWLASGKNEVATTAEILGTLLIETQADILQVHSPAYLAFQAYHAPSVAIMHSCTATWWEAVHGGYLPRDLTWREELVDTGLRNADVVVAPSHSFATAVARRYKANRMVTVYNARRKPPARVATRITGIPDGLFALTAGRLWDEAKSLSTLDAAASLIALPVYAAGSLTSPHSDGITLAATRTLGALSAREMRTLYGARPIFVSCAVYEPFGLSVLEAAQAACPLVLSDIPTFRELWRDAAMFVPAREPFALAQALNALAEDDVLRNRLARASYARSQEFTTQQQASLMSAIYRCALFERMREAAE
ncbi:MAG: glycosyl transferase family 1 [Hyphomicrobiales bacterium]|nr:glycosyl transferase family 1 [Hyphomicrobiales bacterium]